MSCPSTSSSSSTPMTSPDFPPAPYMYIGLFGTNTEPSVSSSPNEDNERPVTNTKREKRKYRCRVRSPATIEKSKRTRRDKANARERRRMDNLNTALENLRTYLPQLPDEPKMTKIETLRVAQWYIKMLQVMAKEGTADNVEDLNEYRNQLYRRMEASPDELKHQDPRACEVTRSSKEPTVLDSNRVADIEQPVEYYHEQNSLIPPYAYVPEEFPFYG